jgi:hypothetical protein
MKQITIISILTLLTGCLASAPKKSIDSNIFTKSGDSISLKESLTLENTEYQSGYSVKVFPYTEKYISLSETENGTKNMDSQEKIKQNINLKNSSLTENKLCFNVQVETFNGLDFAKSRNFVLKLIDGESNIHELKTKTELDVPDLNVRYSKWYNSFISCTDKKIKLEKQIKLNVIPQLKADSGMSEKSELVWDFK